MADWYASSAAYASVPAFVPSAVYTVGQFVKPTAPVLKAQWVFRCTTAGTASTEPTWTSANNGTNTTGGAVFTNVTGQSTYGWSAAAGDIPTLNPGGFPRYASGDRLFVSSDHSETQTTSTSIGAVLAAPAFTLTQMLSVNRAGSVPPVAADLAAGATVTVGTGNLSLVLENYYPVYYYGMSFVYTGSGATSIVFGQSGNKSSWFDNCQLYLNTATAAAKFTNSGGSGIVLNNTTLRFGNAGQTVGLGNPLEISWLNTTSAIAGATLPTILFTPSNFPQSVTMRGVDISAISGTLVTNGGAGCCGSKYLFDSCRIASGVVRYNNTGVVNSRDLVELVNCFDGTSFISESYQPSGAVTTEFTITLTGGATDNVGTFSHKMVSNTNLDKYANPLTGFWMDVNCATTGSAKTATVEIISSTALNNDEISLELEYLGTASSSLASFSTSLPTTVLTTASAVTTSTATWNSSPATPQKQKLQVTFTPRTAGRVRARVRLGKASATVYHDPQVTIT